MSLKLAKNNAPAYDYFSEGDGSDPISIAGTVNGSGGTVDTGVATIYLIATTYRYTNISLAMANEDAAKINWKFSLDNATWLDSLPVPDKNALGGDVVTPVYVKGVLTNDAGANQPATGIYTVPDITVAGVENPA